MTDTSRTITIERIGAVGQVIAYIRQAIRLGEYDVGDKLPKEDELAQLIGVGRSSLREGMRILEAYGVVEVRQGDGTFVTNKTAERFLEYLGYIPGTDFRDFIELRKIIEVGSIASVYDKMTEDDLEELQHEIDLLQIENGLDVCVKADRDFHRIILTKGENPLLVQLEAMIYETRSDYLYKIMHFPDVVADARSAHQAILDALRKKDRIACVEQVLAHLDVTVGHMERLDL